MSLRTNSDDRLARPSLARVERRNGVVEGGHLADVRPHPSVTPSVDDRSELTAISLDDEVDRRAVRGPGRGRTDDRHQRSSISNQTRGPLLDLTADHIEDQIDSADV